MKAASRIVESRNDAFALLTEETGAARIAYTNRPTDLLLAESGRLASRYRLGFTPSDPTSARRTIRVDVARTGLVVRTAAGQRSVTPETAARARFAALLLSADAPKGDFAIAVETKGRVANRTDDALPFDVLVPVSAVYAEDTSTGRRAKLELLVSAVDGRPCNDPCHPHRYPAPERRRRRLLPQGRKLQHVAAGRAPLRGRARRSHESHRRSHSAIGAEDKT